MFYQVMSFFFGAKKELRDGLKLGSVFKDS